MAATSADEFRVRSRLTNRIRKRIIGILVPTVLLVAIIVFGFVRPAGGYRVISILLCPAAVVLGWRLVALRAATVFLATPTGFAMGRRMVEPWSGVSAISIGVHAAFRARRGQLLLSVHRTDAEGRARRPVRRIYGDHYDQPWSELFAYIRLVAPDVRLVDRRDNDLRVHGLGSRR